MIPNQSNFTSLTDAVRPRRGKLLSIPVRVLVLSTFFSLSSTTLLVVEPTIKCDRGQFSAS